MGGSFSTGGEYGCCERKVDVITLLSVLGVITGISVFLRQAVIDNGITGGKKKRSFDFFIKGNLS